MSIPMLLLMTPSMLAFEIISWGYCLLLGKAAIRSKASAWKAIYKYRSWIKERRRKYINRNVNTAYILHAFTPIIKIDYVHTNNVLGWLAGILGYLVAVPAFLPFIFHHEKKH
jgi:hypothetical protein